jgi:predicted AlkP superfamily pyrophosphatase or phosphodiesterase
LVVTADHTQLDVTYTAYPNALFAKNDLLTLDEEGNVTAWRAWSHEIGLSASVYVKDPADEPMVYDLLKKHQQELGVSHIYTKEEAATEGFAGNFSVVLDTDGHTQFSDYWDRPFCVPLNAPRGSHGFHPSKGLRHPILAAGPAFNEGTILEHAHLTDGAPTWAAILGVSLPDADGSALLPLLRDR